MPYYTATQSTIYIGETWADEIFGVRYRTNCNTTPYYGYASSKFDAVVRGKFLAEGEILVYYNKLRYFWTLLVESINAGNKITPQELSSPEQDQEAAADELAAELANWKSASKEEAEKAFSEIKIDPSSFNASSSKKKLTANAEQLWSLNAPFAGPTQGQKWGMFPKTNNFIYSGAGQIVRSVESSPSTAVDSNTSSTPSTSSTETTVTCDLAALERAYVTLDDRLERLYAQYLSSLDVPEELAEQIDITDVVGTEAGGPTWGKRILRWESESSAAIWNYFTITRAERSEAGRARDECRDNTPGGNTGNAGCIIGSNNNIPDSPPDSELTEVSDGSVPVNGGSDTIPVVAPTADPHAAAMSAIEAYLSKYPDGIATLSKKLLSKAIMEMSPNRSPILAASETLASMNDFLGVEIFKLSDIEIAGPFDIMVLTGVDGNSNLNSFRDEKTGTTPALICKLKDCFLTGKAQDIMQNDQLLFTAYTFFAREEL